MTTTIGIRPGDMVLVIERRGEQQIVYHGLVAGISMQEKLAGTRGEPAIEAAFVARTAGEAMARQAIPPGRGAQMAEWRPTLIVPNIVHLSHQDWLEGRAGLAYEELAAPLIGVCAYCRCTDRRGCAEGCHWLDEFHTVCSRCEEAYLGSIAVEPLLVDPQGRPVASEMSA